MQWTGRLNKLFSEECEVGWKKDGFRLFWLFCVVMFSFSLFFVFQWCQKIEEDNEGSICGEWRGWKVYLSLFSWDLWGRMENDGIWWDSDYFVWVLQILGPIQNNQNHTEIHLFPFSLTKSYENTQIAPPNLHIQSKWSFHHYLEI